MGWPRRRWAVTRNGKEYRRCWTESGANRARRNANADDFIVTLLANRIVNGKGAAFPTKAFADFRVVRVGGEQ